jgi:hypothetical protein
MLLFFINWELETIGDKLYPEQKWEATHKGLAAMEHGWHGELGVLLLRCLPFQDSWPLMATSLY